MNCQAIPSFVVGEPECKSPDVVYKFGYRCLNGCDGEGEFIYLCEEHKDRYGYVVSADPFCLKCRSEVELFPLLELVP